ncbi:hypothetical protein ACIA98_43220, partial [Streptomyces sp. NPDC051366]
MSTDARRSYGPLTEGLDVPKDLDLADRSGALEQFGVSPAVHSRIVGVVKDYVADRPASLLLSARHWPLLAARMARMEEAGVPLREHVARLGRDTSWEAGPASGFAGRLVRATHHALITPLGEPLPAGPRVSPGAARSRSATIGGPAPAGRHRLRPRSPRTGRPPRPARGRVGDGVVRVERMRSLPLREGGTPAASWSEASAAFTEFARARPGPEVVVMAAVAGLEAALGDTLAKAVAARGRASAYMAM